MKRHKTYIINERELPSMVYHGDRCLSKVTVWMVRWCDIADLFVELVLFIVICI